MKLAQHLLLATSALTFASIMAPLDAGVLLRSANYYSNHGCGTTPDALDMALTDETCADTFCTRTLGLNKVVVLGGFSCIVDPYAHAAALFGKEPYVLMDNFADTECQVYMGSLAVHANGDCLRLGPQKSARALLDLSGSASFIHYANQFCRVQDAVNTDLVAAEYFQSHECRPGSEFGSVIFYNNAFPIGILE